MKCCKRIQQTVYYYTPVTIYFNQSLIFNYCTLTPHHIYHQLCLYRQDPPFIHQHDKKEPVLCFCGDNPARSKYYNLQGFQRELNRIYRPKFYRYWSKNKCFTHVLTGICTENFFDL
jgi:hypothetical protein